MRRNVWVTGRRTSVSLETAVWDALVEICEREGHGMDALCSMVDQRRQRASLASSLRIFVLGYFRAIADRLTRRARRRRDPADEAPLLATVLARLSGRRGAGAGGRGPRGKRAG
ncbi:MAG: ribbon-helix-helix domain-containing protein [Proteobacteria bacterium]|nr:ribbon-helix-helix domain-containing protein [Pseudomonadota bacterium]MBI3496555.1 ribbon-helix-helix domain-containing protein [Pseudomonadota bacterium]